MSITQLKNIIISINAGNYSKALEDIETLTSFNYIGAEITKEERKEFLDSLVSLSTDFGKKANEIADIFGGTSFVDIDYRIFSDGTDIQNTAELTLKGIKPYKELSFLNGSERSILSLFPVLDPRTKGDVVEYFSDLFTEEMEAKFKNWGMKKELWLYNIKTKYLLKIEEKLQDMYDILLKEDQLVRNVSKETWDTKTHERLDVIYSLLDSYAKSIFNIFEKSFEEKMLKIAPKDATKIVHEMFNDLFAHPAVASIVEAKDDTFPDTEKALKNVENGIFEILKEIGLEKSGYNAVREEIIEPIEEYYKKELSQSGGLLSEVIPVFKTVIPPFKELIKHLKIKAVSPDKTLKGFPENFFTEKEGKLREMEGYLKYGNSNYKIKPHFREDKVTLKIEHPFPKEEIEKLLKKIKPDASKDDIEEAYKNISAEGFLQNYENKMKKGFKKGLKEGTKEIKK